jgi:hypothetical protein
MEAGVPVGGPPAAPPSSDPETPNLEPSIASSEPGIPNLELRPSAPQPSTLNLQPLRNESDRAFEAFRVYWELGPRRRYVAVSRKLGTSLRTIRRWATEHNWKERIKSCSAQCAQEQAQTETEVHRGELLDMAARAKALRERQFALAEAILDAVERYVQSLEEFDLDAMTFADACKALEVASRLGQQAATRLADDPAEASRSLQDQLAALLDQAYGEVSGSPRPSADPSPVGRERVAARPGEGGADGSLPPSDGRGVRGEGDQSTTPTQPATP